MIVAIIGIDYDEGDPNSYRAVTVKIGEEEKRFDGGLPEHDWANALAHARKQTEHIYLSSNCDHFVNDGFRYGWTEDSNLYRLTDYEIGYYWRV